MRKILSLILTASFVFSSPGESTEVLTPKKELRRTALILKGELPYPSDYQDVDYDRSQLGKLQDEYLESEEFIQQMSKRLYELFSLKLKDSRYGLPDSDSFNRLTTKLIKENQSWDLLLTQHQYELDTGDYGGFGILPTEREVFMDVFPDEISNADISDAVTLTAKTNDQIESTAGVLSTMKFLQRFTTTKTNKNRRRAAAIFRIFLCDDMKPAVLPSAEEDLELLQKVLEHEMSKPGSGKPLMTTEQRHGKDAQCTSCHYKLDPAAKTLVNSASTLSGKPANGALVFTRDDNSPVNISVKGLGGLGVAITQQPEYARCQVKHFWNWIIGKDVVPSQARMDFLVHQFNRVGRKPKSFIKILLNTPEFRTPPVSGEMLVRFEHVQPLLSHCNQCHSQVLDRPLPSFDRLPIGGSLESNAKWIAEIVRQADVLHDGAKAQMPLRSASWRPTAKEFALLRAWISRGAPDSKGQNTLNASKVNEILEGQTYTYRADYTPGFEDNYFRYMKWFEYTDSVYNLFYKSFDRCDNLNETGKANMGFSDPALGRPSFPMPTPSTFRQYISCAAETVEQITVDDLQLIGFPRDLAHITWQNLDQGVKFDGTLRLVRKVQGELSEEEAKTRTLKLLAIYAYSNLPSENVAKQMTQTLLTQKQFYTY